MDTYRWLFSATDEQDNTFYLSDDEFVGTYAEASKEGNRLSGKWESQTNGLILRLELERRGKQCS